jgi:hypothetical protein
MVNIVHFCDKNIKNGSIPKRTHRKNKAVEIPIKAALIEPKFIFSDLLVSGVRVEHYWLQNQFGFLSGSE